MRNIAIFIALVSLTSCAQVPKELAYPISYQYKMQASEHWKLLAKKVAEEVKLEIGNGKGPVSMSSNVDYSLFGAAMRTLLDTELKRQGIGFSTAVGTSPYTLVLEVQPVSHMAERRNTCGGLPAFLLLDVPQGILLGETDYEYNYCYPFSFLPAFLLPRTKPHSEIIVTYELFLKNGCSLLRNSEIFYINDADFYHYVAMTGPSLVSDLGSVRYNMKDN